RLAAAFGARVLGRGGAQEARAQACVREDRWPARLSDRRPQHRRCAERLIMRRQVTDPAAIAAEIDRLRTCAPDALRRRWRVMFGRTPPAALSKDLLARMIARRMPGLALGGLDRESLTFLDALAHRTGPRPRQLKAGTVLVRDYQGERHTVTVGREGFDW